MYFAIFSLDACGACASSPSCCKYPTWKGDGYCDDENNNEGCEYDGGDCCGHEVITQYCSACQCLDPGIVHCQYPQWQGDGYCDDQNNTGECEWDGGDCCGNHVKRKYCSDCHCLNPAFPCGK